MSEKTEGEQPETVHLTPEMVENGCRLVTEEEMKKVPTLFESLGICDGQGQLLVSP